MLTSKTANNVAKILFLYMSALFIILHAVVSNLMHQKSYLIQYETIQLCGITTSC